MPESGTYGSVRGVPGNRHPYRDRQQLLSGWARTQEMRCPVFWLVFAALQIQGL